MTRPTLSEEVGVPLNELACHGGGGKLVERIPPVRLVCADLDLLDFVDGHRRRPPQALDDDLRAHTCLNMLLDLFQDLTRQDNH